MSEPPDQRMSSRKTNWRLKKWEKLCKFKLTDKKQIVKLQLEDLKDVISDPTFQNILLLRKYIREGNETKFFDESSEENEREEET